MVMMNGISTIHYLADFAVINPFSVWLKIVLLTYKIIGNTLSQA